MDFQLIVGMSGAFLAGGLAGVVAMCFLIASRSNRAPKPDQLCYTGDKAQLTPIDWINEKERRKAFILQAKKPKHQTFYRVDESE